VSFFLLQAYFGICIGIFFVKQLVSIVTVSSCGRYVASATLDGQLTVWSISRRSCVATYVVNSCFVCAVDGLQNCSQHSFFLNLFSKMPFQSFDVFFV